LISYQGLTCGGAQEYEIDIEGLRKLHPGLKDFAAWLEGGRRGGKATWAR